VGQDYAGTIKAAREFAEAAHEGQKRKFGGKPYFVHPERVAMALSGLGKPTEMIVAGYLHDVVEDCGVKIEKIREEFGGRVAELVDGMTNKTHDSRLPRAERKRMDRERLKGMSDDVKVIKLVDRLDNIEDLADADADFKKKYAEETFLLLDAIGDADMTLAWQIYQVARRLAGDGMEDLEAALDKNSREQQVLKILGEAKLDHARWEDDEDIVTLDGKPIGGTISRNRGPQFGRWWPEVKRELAARIAEALAQP